MMAPKLDKDKVGICHYILFTNPNRLLGSHKKLCGETYASMVRKHIQTSDVKYDEQGNFMLEPLRHVINAGKKITGV